jgi:hypothetical protein
MFNRELNAPAVETEAVAEEAELAAAAAAAAAVGEEQEEGEAAAQAAFESNANTHRSQWSGSNSIDHLQTSHESCVRSAGVEWGPASHETEERFWKPVTDSSTHWTKHTTQASLPCM